MLYNNENYLNLNQNTNYEYLPNIMNVGKSNITRNGF